MIIPKIKRVASVTVLQCFVWVATFAQIAVPTAPPQTSKPPKTVLNTPGTPAVVRPGIFSLAVIPDTQYYTAQYQLGGSFDMFKAQIAWIQANQQKENIAYVAHMGDITEHGDNPVTEKSEWYLAKTALYGLENPVSIPYGLQIGNHDQYPSQHAVTGTTNGYNKHFGVDHFAGRSYYGGHYGDNNDSHYDLFTAGGVNFIVIYLEYDQHNEDVAGRLAWANQVLKKYADRKAIVVSHSILMYGPKSGSLEPYAGYTPEGPAVYEGLKANPNVFMMLCGHVGDNGEGYRVEKYNGHTIRLFLNDYQSRENGGNGMMRLYTFNVKDNTISVRTFSAYTGKAETDADSQFIVPLFDVPARI